MNTQEASTQQLLSKILENPAGPAYTALCSALNTEAGYNDFVQNLKSNNALAFIFLKQYCQPWIDSGSMQILYSEDFTLFLLKLCLSSSTIKDNNRFYVGEFLEILSVNYLVPESILVFLVEHRAFPFLDSIFKKYTTHPKSNRLFTEINRSIELVSPVFRELYFQESVAREVETEYQKVLAKAQQACMSSGIPFVPVNVANLFSDESVLSIFYSLVYQDIHPFFEDNTEYFFKVFFLLFEKEENKEMINSIFDLYITKYPEFANFELIIITLSRVGRADASFVNTLTKAFNYKRIFPELIAGFILEALNNPDENSPDDDWLLHTKNTLKGVDMQRGCLHKLIKLLNPSVYLFKGESMLFIASVLKDMGIVGSANQLVNQYTEDRELVFSAFRYLITVQEYGLCSLNYLDTDLKFICMKFISNSLKSKDSYHRDTMVHRVNVMSFRHNSGIESVPNSPAFGIWERNVLGSVFEKCLKTAEDEFSSELLFRIVKNDDELLTHELYDFITRLFNSINSIAMQSVVHLFDVYNLLTIKFKKANLGLVEYIFNNELVDLYSLCFCYLSILIQETTIKQSFIIQVLGQDALWSVKELHLGLSFMLISAYAKGIANKEHVQHICELLEGYPRVLVLYKTGNQLGMESMEENYLVNGVFDSEWFLGNFINKRYARLTLKKMMQDARIDRRIKEEVFLKNRMNMEYEVALHSLVRYFDI